MCSDLKLNNSFALLDPAETLRSQASISWLPNGHIASTSGSLFTRSSQSYDFDVHTAVAVSQSSVPIGASPIGNEMSPALPAGRLHSSLVQPGSEVTTTFLDRSSSKVPQPNSLSTEQLSLVEAGVRRYVDGDTDLMVRNDLQTQGWFSRYPLKHQLTEFL